MFDDIKKLIADARAGQVGDVMIDAGNLSIKLGETYNALIRGEKLAVDETKLERGIADLQTCKVELETAPKSAAGDEKDMDPATILMFVKLGLEAAKALAEFIRKRREGK